MLDTETLTFTDEFGQKLPDMLGDAYYNDPETKQQPTKMFENIKDLPGLVKMAATAQRQASKGEAAYAEKLKGMVKLPDEKANEEEIAAYRQAIGVPESADKYELALPETDDKAAYESIAKTVRDAAFTAGIPAKLLTPVWQRVVEGLAEQTKALDENGRKIIEGEIAKLKNEWSGEYDSRVKAGEEALAKFKSGADVKKLLEDFGLINAPAVRKLLHELSPLVVEGATVTGGPAQPAVKDWPLTYQYDETGKPKQ